MFHRLRKTRIGLRTLLLLVGIVAVFLAFISTAARNQKRAVDSILDLKSRVYYSYQLDGDDYEISNPKLFAPSFLRQLIGDDYFRTVVTDDLSGTKTADENIEHLRLIPNLRYLRLDGTDVTNKSLNEISRLNNLESLDVSRTAIDDDGILLLTEMPNLRIVLALETGVTRAGVDKFKSVRPECDVRIEH